MLNDAQGFEVSIPMLQISQNGRTFQITEKGALKVKLHLKQGVWKLHLTMMQKGVSPTPDIVVDGTPKSRFIKTVQFKGKVRRREITVPSGDLSLVQDFFYDDPSVPLLHFTVPTLKKTDA